MVHCLAQDGGCDWWYDKHEKDWLCMHCGIWEKTAERVRVPIQPRMKPKVSSIQTEGLNSAG